MTIDDAKQALEQLKNAGESEEDILKVLYLMYVDGKMDLSDLRTFTELLGYEFTEDFEKMPDNEKKIKGLIPNREFFSAATLQDAANSFAKVCHISFEDAKEVLNAGLKNGKSYFETVTDYQNQCLANVNNLEIPLEYYCTKKISFPSLYILDKINETFVDNGTDKLSFEDIYKSLQVKLNMSSVNRSNLQSFLSFATNNDTVYQSSIIIMRDCCANSSNQAQDESGTNSVLTFSNDFEINCEDDLDYHFSKMNKAPKDLVLKFVIDIFNESESTSLTIKQIYQGLSTKLEITSVNMSKLVELLGTKGDTISKKAVEKRLDDFYTKVDEYRKNEFEKDVRTIKKSIANIHIDNYEIPLKEVARPGLYRFFESINAKKISDLQNMCDDDIRRMLTDCEKTCIDFFNGLCESFAVAFCDKFKTIVIEQINKHGEKKANWNRDVDIIYKRAKGETLASSGGKYALTREAVRLIEVKYMKKFEVFSNSCYGGLVKNLKMFANNPNFITLQELSNVISQYRPAFCYFLKLYESEDICYIDELGVFAFISPIDWYSLIIDSASELPDTIDKRVMDESIAVTSNRLFEYGLNIPYSFVEKLFKINYKQSGDFYSKDKMTLREKYVRVIEKHFPQGIHVYDDHEMQIFRSNYAKMFSKDELPENNRAIVSAITSQTVLCDRGVYKSWKNTVYPTDLLNEICEYINTSKQEILALTGLYYIFEDKLIEAEVTNRYYLQGLLRRYAGDKYFFTRDYISKSQNAVSFYSTITSYIKDSGCIVTKEDLQKEFPGITPVVISLALTNDDIIVGQSLYAHKDYILNNQGYIDTLRYLITDIVKDGKIHNSAELMQKLKNNFPSLMRDFKIADRYFLFSIIEALFPDEFSLRRPFFAKKGIVIENQKERLIEFVREKGSVDISEFMGYIYSNKFVAPSIIGVVNGIIDQVFILDNNTLIDSELLNVDESMITLIENALPSMLNKIGCVMEGADFSSLPTINNPWTEWLLYSVVKKYSKQYTTSTTDNAFAQARPIFIKQ